MDEPATPPRSAAKGSSTTTPSTGTTGGSGGATTDYNVSEPELALIFPNATPPPPPPPPPIFEVDVPPAPPPSPDFPELECGSAATSSLADDDALLYARGLWA